MNADSRDRRLAKYKEWISSYVKSVDGFTRGKCGHATAAMKLEFPELSIVKGFAHCEWGADQHFWCIDPEGYIIDPTASQFGPLGPFEYEELDLENPSDIARIPVGKCMECGERTFKSSYASEMCSKDCADAFDASLRL